MPAYSLAPCKEEEDLEHHDSLMAGSSLEDGCVQHQRCLLPKMFRPTRRQGWAAGLSLIALVAARHLIKGAVVDGGNQVQPIEGNSRLVHHASVDATTQLQLDDLDPCRGFPNLILDAVLHSNLGGQGPDAGPEGLVIAGREAIQGQTVEEVLLVINATSPYFPADPKQVGLSGNFGTINLNGGTNVRMKFRIFNRGTMRQQLIKGQQFTFFDLDMAPSGETTEYVKAWGFHTATLTKRSELTMLTNSDGSTTFAASKEGNGADGPEDPLLLTIHQKNRAVTLEWANSTEIELELGCSAGWHARYFTFVARPSLWCALTSTPFGVGPNPELNKTVNTAVAIQTGTTTQLVRVTERPHNCWFNVFGWCVQGW